MQTSVAPSSRASRARRTTSSTGKKYPSSSRWSRLKAQKVQCLMQTFVKLTLRLTTNVTTSPTCRRRSSSAAAVRASRSRPRATARVRPSAAETSAPSRARARTRRTAGEAPSRPARTLPASPVLMGLLDQTVAVDEGRHPRAERLGQELGPPRELRVDGQALAEGEPLALGGTPELRDQRPGGFGIDVIDREGRD